jgi:hypothetical protein
MKDDLVNLPKDLLVKLFRSFVSYSHLYETFYILIHDEIVKKVTTLSNDELEMLKQPMLVKRDLFYDSPLQQLLTK